jgi:hypothetical protein
MRALTAQTKERMSLFKKVLLFVFFSGWLVTAWLGVSVLFSWFENGVSPRMAGDDPMNSFPFLSFAKSMLTISGVWLSLVVVAVSALGLAGLGPRPFSRSVNKQRPADA